MSTTAPLPPGTIRCPRCDAPVGPEQDWCLECGAPARTRLAPRPNWKLPVAIAAALIVASIVALAIAFVSLTGNDNSATATTPATTTAPAATTAPAVIPPPATTTTTPAPTVPPTSTAAPATPLTAPTTTP